MQGSPCLKCNRRYIACHDNCEKYIQWKKIHNERNEKIKIGRIEDSIMNELSIKRNKNFENSKRKRGNKK